MRNEIKNSLFRAGNTQFGLSSNLSGTNMAIDLAWLQKQPEKFQNQYRTEVTSDRIYILTICRMPLYTVESKSGSSLSETPRKDMLSYLLLFSFGRELEFPVTELYSYLIPSPLKLCIFVSIYGLY